MKALFQVATGECIDQVNLVRLAHQEYCDKYGYKYIVYSDDVINTDPYFAKLFFARELVCNGYSEVVCLDADTMIQNINISFSDAISGPQEVYVTECEIAKGDYSTGVMIIHNTGRVINFINTILEFGQRNPTIYCDQGAFNAIAKYVVEYQGLVCKIERYWNSLYNNGENNKIVAAFHGAQNKVEKMQAYMKELERE